MKARHAAALIRRSPEDFRVSELSTFQENIWDRTQEFPLDPPSRAILNFNRLRFEDGSAIGDRKNECYMQILKRFAWRMIVQVSAPKWTNVCDVLMRGGVPRLLKFMQRKRIRQLDELSRKDLREFLNYLAHEDGNSRTDTALLSRARGLDWLYQQGQMMPNGLRLDPFDDWGGVYKWAERESRSQRPKYELLTPEIPDEVARALMCAALKELDGVDRYVKAKDDYAERMRERKHFWLATIVPLAKSRENIESFDWTLYGYTTSRDSRRHRTHLLTAAYIVIAMLTGMRRHEILAIPATSYWSRHEDIVDGLVCTSYFVHSRTSKLHPDWKEERWQTLPFVEAILNKVALLNREHIDEAGKFLFATNHRARRGFPPTPCVVSKWLHSFCVRHSIHWRGAAYRVRSHQFRRTFARLLFRQGLGLKEIQEQLKHFDVNMTRRYSSPALYVELEAERFSVSKELYEELMNTQTPIIGGGAAYAKQLRAEFMGMSRTSREAFLAELPKTALIDVMPEGLCLYNAKRALCGGDKVNCKPAHCENSVIPLATVRRTLMLRKRENEELLKLVGTSRVKRAHIEEQLRTVDELLLQARLEDAS